jgi:hypothetical protein
MIFKKRIIVVSRKIVLSMITYNIAACAFHCSQPEQLHIGNFALPSSQQPSTLYGFGQYIVDEGDLLAGMAPSVIAGKRSTALNTFTPYILYGIRDDLTLLVSLPVTMSWHTKCDPTTSGLADAFVECEYLLYSYKTEADAWETSLDVSLVLPFGNDLAIPITGFGSPSFFVGLITRYISTEWYWYISGGGLFTTKHNNTRFGNNFLYQTGFGKNVGYEPDVWLCMVMLEMNGIYLQKDRVCGEIDPNSSGNVIGLGPTVWFSTQKFIFQAGILPVIYQHWSGDQAKWTMFIDLNFEWKF